MFGLPGGPGDEWLSANYFLDWIVIGGFSADVQGVGGNFFSTDVFGTPLVNQLVEVIASDALGSTSITFDGSSANSFRGFVSTSGIQSLRMRSISPNALRTWPTLNDVVLGGAPSVAPEPNSLGFLALGLLGLVLTVRARIGRSSVRL